MKALSKPALLIVSALVLATGCTHRQPSRPVLSMTTAELDTLRGLHTTDSEAREILAIEAASPGYTNMLREQAAVNRAAEDIKHIITRCKYLPESERVSWGAEGLTPDEMMTAASVLGPLDLKAIREITAIERLHKGALNKAQKPDAVWRPNTINVRIVP